MTHSEFVAGYHEGRVRAVIDREAAARFVSGRAVLPLVLLPILGLGVALALRAEDYSRQVKAAQVLRGEEASTPSRRS